MNYDAKQLIELIRKYDKPGPRYTSYPTALQFSESYGSADYLKDLAEADRRSDKPLSLYFHLPFCEARCAFCACNVIIAPKHEVSLKYLDYLQRETDRIAAYVPNRRQVAQLHFGGGTPTFQSPAELRALYRSICRDFEILPGAEVSIEVDPCVTSEEHLKTLRELGFNRLSLGVQDLSEDVQAAIRRNQSAQDTERLYYLARDLGFKSINIDLIYGLPLQRVESFGDTIEQVIDMRPDRIALYSFAHLPDMKHNQDAIDPAALPAPEEKLALFVTAMGRLLNAGYKKIGMDHFALPEDDLAMALEDRRLHRNFMGYTVRPTDTTLGFGVSSIGETPMSQMQNTKKLTKYYHALEAGMPPTERGYRLTEDDAIRRDVIQSVMCNFFVDFERIDREHGIDSTEYFATEFEELNGLEDSGFIQRQQKTLEVTKIGQLFVRNVAMVFDAYLRKVSEGKRKFSRTV